MIVDIIELTFNEDNMYEYFGAYPTVVPDPHIPDDIYFMGHDSHANITKIFHRYKFIEHISGEVHEHIVLTKDKIQFPLHKNQNIELFPISTRRHTPTGPETFRYIKTIANIMYSLNVHTTFKAGIRTVHQVAISAIYNFYGSGNGFAPDIESILGEYCKSRHMELSYLSTASISETSNILANMLEINQTLSSSLFDKDISSAETCSYLDTALALPRPNLHVGFIRVILAANSNRVNPKWQDIHSLINTSTMGMYSTLVPQQDVYKPDRIMSVNSHLSNEPSHGDDGNIEPILLGVLNHIELSPYTDVSIEFPYTEKVVPDVTVHYSGSIFNHGTVSHNGYVTNLMINFAEVIHAFILLYGEANYIEAKPTITITRTFAEEVYVKYETPDGVDYVECYDLTLMALLSPTILDGEAERFILASMHA